MESAGKDFDFSSIHAAHSVILLTQTRRRRSVLRTFEIARICKLIQNIMTELRARADARACNPLAARVAPAFASRLQGDGAVLFSKLPPG
jgi:hypothetical protein